LLQCVSLLLALSERRSEPLRQWRSGSPVAVLSKPVARQNLDPKRAHCTA